MAYNDDRGCGMTTDKDVRVARAWTAFSVLTVSAGTVAGWFAEEWIWKATALAVQIQYIDAGAPPVVYSAVANSDDPPAQNVSVPESIPKPSSEEDAIEV